MDKSLQNRAIEEIRKAQTGIAVQMQSGELSISGQSKLEEASLHLRNMERMITESLEKSIVKALKRETLSLDKLSKEINEAAGRLVTLNGILRKIVKIAGQIIDILEMVP